MNKSGLYFILIITGIFILFSCIKKQRCDRLISPVSQEETFNNEPSYGLNITWDSNGQFLPDSNTVALWHFNENAGLIVYDSTTHHNDGVIVNTPYWLAGRFGSALKYNDTNTSIIVESNHTILGMTNSFTIEVWAKSDLTYIDHDIMIYRGDTAPGVDNYVFKIVDNAVSFGFNDFSNNEYFAEFSISSNELTNWNYYAGVYDKENNEIRLYINGVLKSKISVEATPANRNNFWVEIGSIDRNDIPGRWYGLIDEIRISKGVRSSEEISAYYNYVNGL